MSVDRTREKTISARNKIKERLVDATLKRLSHSGIEGVNARELAKEVGCSVGTIYNAVGDLDNLILLALFK